MTEKSFNFDGLVLTRGSHATREQGLCAMEAVAWLAEDERVKTPASRVVSRYVERVNDAQWSSNKARTDAFKPWLRRLAGTCADADTEFERARWLTRRALTWWAPLAGVATVMLLEMRGHDCGPMRAAYLALLKNPCRATAMEARAACLCDSYDIDQSYPYAAYDNTVDAVDALDAVTDGYSDYAAVCAAAVAALRVATAVVHAADAVGRCARYAAGDDEADDVAYCDSNCAAAQDLVLRDAVEDLDALLRVTGSISRGET